MALMLYLAIMTILAHIKKTEILYMKSILTQVLT